MNTQDKKSRLYNSENHNFSTVNEEEQKGASHVGALQVQDMLDEIYVVTSIDRHREDVFYLFRNKREATIFAQQEFRKIIKKKILTKEWWEKADQEIEDGYSTYLDGDYAVSVDDIENTKDFLTLQQERHKEKMRKILKMVQQAYIEISKVDKTPKYEYTHKKCDANNYGEFAGVGKRWAMPWELAESLAKNVEDIINKKIESL